MQNAHDPHAASGPAPSERALLAIWDRVDRERLARLLIATTLAYLWVVYLGVVARRDALRGRIHRSDRCDLSLFSLGLRLLAYCLRHQRTIPRGLPKPLVLARQHALKSSVR